MEFIFIIERNNKMSKGGNEISFNIQEYMSKIENIQKNVNLENKKGLDMNGSNIQGIKEYCELFKGMREMLQTYQVLLGEDTEKMIQMGQEFQEMDEDLSKIKI